jgi:hypothetical protein
VEQEQLLEGVVLASHAAIQPALGDAEQLREKPGLVIAVIVPEIPLQGELGQAKGHFAQAPFLEVVQVVDARLAHDGGVLHLGGHVRCGERQARGLGERGGQAFALDVIAVAQEPGKGDLAGDAGLQGADARGHGPGLGVHRGPAARDEGEGHAVDLGVFRVEPALFVGCVAHAA